jgi:hypothetical protein
MTKFGDKEVGSRLASQKSQRKQNLERSQLQLDWKKELRHFEDLEGKTRLAKKDSPMQEAQDWTRQRRLLKIKVFGKRRFGLRSPHLARYQQEEEVQHTLQ